MFGRAAIAASVMVSSATATAQGAAPAVEFNLGIAYGYLIAGDSLVKGRRANPTGGTTIIPFGRVSAGIPGVDWLDVVYTQSPMLVTPFSVDQLGIVDANDLGVSFHSAARRWNVVLSGTIAPAWMTFCNVQWCLREWTLMGGADVRGGVALVDDEKGRGFRLTASVRGLYAQPTAWTWPALTDEERSIIPTIVMLAAGGEWVW